MKALSIHQPFASLIADGAKWVENRTWGTTYRGPIAIHASRTSRYLTPRELREYPTGCVVAVAWLGYCERIDRIRAMPNDALLVSRISHYGFEAEYWEKTAEDILAHKHTEGPYCWILAAVRKLEQPVPYIGRQGLFEIPMPDEIINA